MKTFFYNLNLKSGQTLIETLAALFILVMGISAATGLSVYALNSSSSITKAIIATGLAREGLEAVRNMRDTNWLQDTLVTNGCYDFITSSNNKANCYQNWLGNNAGSVPFCINPSPGASCNGSDSTDSYFLGFDNTTANFWVLKKDNVNYGLNFDSANAGNSGFYYPGNNNAGVSCSLSNSGYCRKITITKYNSTAPYNQDPNLILVKVQSQVWWTDKKCPAVNNYPGAGSCSIELDTYLTNWKNY